MICSRNIQNGIICLLFVAACFAVAGVGGSLSGNGSGEWYSQIRKPVFNPPDWVFGPVWTVLYLSMGIAAWLVWLQREKHPLTRPLTLFAIQLVLNGLWMPLFFGMRNPGLAFLDIVALWFAIAGTIWLFLGISRKAGYLLAPYLIWVSYALVLNFELWRLN